MPVHARHFSVDDAQRRIEKKSRGKEGQKCSLARGGGWKGRLAFKKPTFALATSLDTTTRIENPGG